ncbi:hypothetical protein WG66_016155 [Moniliophthora roreri]|nr:hypothetical protein WG66_016155 [Moniliophthora roreri]
MKALDFLTRQAPWYDSAQSTIRIIKSYILFNAAPRIPIQLGTPWRAYNPSFVADKNYQDVYWTAFPTDILRAKVLVYGLYILETVQTAFLTYDAFQNFVFGFMDPVSVDRIHSLWLNAYVFDGLAALLVQIYFSHRIHVLLSRTKLIPGIIVSLSIIQFIGSIGVGAIFKSMQFFSRGPEISRSQKYTNILGFSWVIGAAIADILIAVTMVYALSRYDTSFRETRNLLKRLNRLTMETGSLTAVTAVVQPLLFFAYPDRNYWVMPALFVAKLYSNSLLVIFNSRVRIHGARGSNDTRTSGGGWRTTISVTPIPDQGEIIPLSDLSQGHLK